MLQQIIILLLGLLSQFTPLEIEGDRFFYSSEKECIGLENQNAKGAKELKSVNVWEKLRQAGVTDLGSKIDEIKSIANKYLDDLPNTNIADEIAQAGSYRKWYDTKVLGNADELFDLSKNSRLNELLDKRSSLAFDEKSLSAEELTELNKLKGELPKTDPVTLEKTIAEYPDIPLDKEFTQKVKVKFTGPQPSTDPKYFDMQFKIENNSIKGIKEGYYDYVITMNGELKIGGGHYYLSGSSEYVKAAGRLDIDAAGKLKSVDGNSGHYKPSYQENEVAKDLFEELGLFAN